MNAAEEPKRWPWLIGLLVACFSVAGIGGASTASSVTSWYAELAKPSWNPPDWLFGPVWTVLYFAMAIAAWWVVRRSGRPGVRGAMISFAIQLLLNLGWSLIFFGLQRPGWALVEICILWLVLTTTVVAFFRVSRPAGWLMVPYLGWVSFAAVLNFTIWQLNN